MKSLVLGAGIVGLNIALTLQENGRAVTIIEPEKLRKSASYGNAGHIAIEQVEPLASMGMVMSVPRRLFAVGGALDLPLQSVHKWLPFTLRLLNASKPSHFQRGKQALTQLMSEAMPAWQRRVKNLGDPSLIRQDGHYVVWESPETATNGLASWQKTDTGSARFHLVTDDELSALKSITALEFIKAIRFENTGQVTDNRRLLEALESQFLQSGGQIFYEKAKHITVEGGLATVRLEDDITLTANEIIVSAGIGSKTLLSPLGLKIPIISERGYHIQTPTHGWPDGLAPVVFEDRSMIVTGFDSGLRAASFVELGDKDDAPDARKWQQLHRHVKQLNLPFGNPKEADKWYGARPTLPDYLPAIGKVDEIRNLYYAFGHQHLGLTLGPVTGEIVSDMVIKGTAPEAFSLKRFQ